MGSCWVPSDMTGMHVVTGLKAQVGVCMWYVWVVCGEISDGLKVLCPVRGLREILSTPGFASLQCYACSHSRVRMLLTSEAAHKNPKEPDRAAQRLTFSASAAIFPGKNKVIGCPRNQLSQWNLVKD